MNISERRSTATREDLARATLQTVLNNIGLIARDCATNYVRNFSKFSISFSNSFLLILSVSLKGMRASFICRKLFTNQRSIEALTRLRHRLLVERDNKSPLFRTRSNLTILLCIKNH